MIRCDSDAYSVKHITYQWKSGADSVGVGKDLNQMQFILRGYRNIEKLEVLSTGKAVSFIAYIMVFLQDKLRF